jgi:signal transduction histidine kinase
MWKKLLTIYGIFAVSLAVLVGLSLYSFQRYNAYVNYTDAVDHHYLLLTELYKLKTHLTEAENYQRGLLLYEDSTFLDHYNRCVQSIKSSFGTVHQLTSSDSDQQKRAYSLNMAIKSQLDFLTTGMTVGDPNFSYVDEQKAVEKCITLIAEMERAEKLALSQRKIIKEFYENRTPQYFTIVFIFTLLVFCVSFGLLAGQYRSRLKYQRSLEDKIIELNQANAEAEQMSYVAAHDLQEPLRKIRTFSDLLLDRHIVQLDEEGQTIIKRIDVASTRAQSLMQDIVNYNTIAYAQEEAADVDIGQVVSDIAQDPDHPVKQSKSIIQFADLPVIKGYPSQISLLFRSLFENSVKFAQPGIPCVINVTATTVDQADLPIEDRKAYSRYNKIMITDNGIGFDNKFAAKIFQMFQRLHTQESSYKGRGLGLALVKRIMTNHHGLVTAEGQPEKGATFTLYFPVQ